MGDDAMMVRPGTTTLRHYETIRTILPTSTDVQTNSRPTMLDTYSTVYSTGILGYCDTAIGEVVDV